MKQVLIIGIGRSSSVLVDYFLEYSKSNNTKIVLLDYQQNEYSKTIKNTPLCSIIFFDIYDKVKRHRVIKKSDIVISMLPPRFHTLIAKDCINFKKNLVTASYVSPEMLELDSSAKESNILILNEIGLDPGIDHLSAMKIINSLNDEGANILSFKSFCGGLIAPDSSNNPWDYKFTWNPRNVVLAGKDGSKYLKDGSIKELKYNEVFANTEKITIPQYGDFESYANRNSLNYIKKYNLENIKTLVRGTLRRPGFCSSWDILVRSGLTSFDNIDIKNVKKKYQQLKKEIDNDHLKNNLEYLDIFNQKDNFNSPGEFLQNILEKKWALSKRDKDMIVMQHKFEYELNKISYRLTSSMVLIGSDDIKTAMAKTVGLPVFFAAKLILEGNTTLKGIKIPVHKELYSPILKSLENEGISFIDSIEEI